MENFKRQKIIANIWLKEASWLISLAEGGAWIKNGDLVKTIQRRQEELGLQINQTSG